MNRLKLFFILLISVMTTEAVSNNLAQNGRTDTPTHLLSLSDVLQPLTTSDYLNITPASYTFSAATAGSINYIRLCIATNNTCSSCAAPFTAITMGTPVPYSISGTTYAVSASSLAHFLNESAQSAGTYNIGLYVQSSGFNCSSATGYCSTKQDSNNHNLCMQAIFDGTTVSSVSQSDNGFAVLNTTVIPYVYVDNSNVNSNTVTQCTITASGGLTLCNTTGSGFGSPQGNAVTVNATFAYIANNTGSIPVSLCSINSTTGNLGSCATSNNTGAAFSGPRNIAFNRYGTVAYVSNAGNTVSRCPMNSNGTFGACAATGSGFNAPRGIAVNVSGTIAYVANRGNNTVSKCIIASNGTWSGCVDSGNTAAGGVAFNRPASIAINPSNTIAYVTNAGNNTVSKCPINSNGTFAACVGSGNTGLSFSTPQGIFINPANTFAYVANETNNQVYQCPISNGSFGNCVDSGVGTTFSSPIGLSQNSVRP